MKDKICKALGSNIKNYRKLRGYTQENLAEAVGLEIKSLSLVETGKGFVSAKTLAKLCEVLNVKPAELFEFDDSNDEQELYKSAEETLELLKNNADKLRTLNFLLKGLI